VGLTLNGTHHLLAYADNVSLLGDNIETIKRKTETLMLSRLVLNVYRNSDIFNYSNKSKFVRFEVTWYFFAAYVGC
jgi:hypothetical protein